MKTLARLPIVPMALVYCGFLYWGHNEWMHSPESELGMKKASIQAAKQDLESSKKKLVAAEEFFKNLDALRARIRQLTSQLDGTKTTLSADIDIANFVRMITLEAKKLGLGIKGIKPEEDVRREYYVEVPFSVAMRGAYVQILVFFDRVAKFQQVIRIADFEMKPSGNVFTKYVELESSVRLVAYKYLGTKADEVVNQDAMQGNERQDLDAPAKPGKRGAGK